MPLPILSAYLGHVHVADTQWYLSGSPELMREAMRRLEHRWEGRHDHSNQLGSAFATFLYSALDAAASGEPTYHQFYRDTFRQFLKFIQQRLRKPPSRLTFEEIDAPLIVASWMNWRSSKA